MAWAYRHDLPGGGMGVRRGNETGAGLREGRAHGGEKSGASDADAGGNGSVRVRARGVFPEAQVCFEGGRLDGDVGGENTQGLGINA